MKLKSFNFLIGLLLILYFSPLLSEEKIDIWKNNKENKNSTVKTEEQSIQEKSKPEMYEIRKETSTPCAFCDEKINCKQYAMLPKES